MQLGPNCPSTPIIHSTPPSFLLSALPDSSPWSPALTRFPFVVICVEHIPCPLHFCFAAVLIYPPHPRQRPPALDPSVRALPALQFLSLHSFCFPRRYNYTPRQYLIWSPQHDACPTILGGALTCSGALCTKQSCITRSILKSAEGLNSFGRSGLEDLGLGRPTH